MNLAFQVVDGILYCGALLCLGVAAYQNGRRGEKWGHDNVLWLLGLELAVLSNVSGLLHEFDWVRLGFSIIIQGFVGRIAWNLYGPKRPVEEDVVEEVGA